MNDPMPTCRELLEYLADYMEGELPPRETKILEQHLDLCPPCIEYLETYKSTILLARSCIPKPVTDEACDACPEDLIRAIVDAQRRPPNG